jgi:hypothetical protein
VGARVPDNGSGSAETFIKKWQGVTASELSTSQSFLHDLCALIEVDKPHPTPEQDYMFERPVTFKHGDGSTSPGRIDLYRRGAFVLESKKLRKIAQPKGVDEAMLRARSQAEEYARALPAAEGRPPFVIVVDVGARIELYSEFSRSGATYTPFPDPRSHRIELKDLAKPEIRARLHRLWIDPLALDPSREAARVTRDIARQLAELARSLEGSGYLPERVAQFLMRCLFTMFAEDVRLLPTDSFRNLLQKHADEPEVAMRMVGILWQNMDSGGFSPVLAGEVLHFNGKLFKQAEVLPLDKEQLARLIDAAKADWKHVEPAIFGTLLERALTPEERHKLGAHFTPRAYVERLVLPSVIEPLRAEWSDAQAAALTLATEGKLDDSVRELRRFHKRLCDVRVLDPACGSGNFLYVTLEHLKRLEGEVLNALDEIGFRQGGLALGGERADSTAAETVDPHNLLGIELNPRAAAIAEVVLWIGYLQWHFRTRGNVNPPQPVIRDFRNIENRDAVLAYDKVENVLDEDGKPVTRWDGITMKLSPVTGEEIPDESARVPVERYVNPRKAEWPQADFVVGNPPFIGNKRMRMALGDGYVEALRSTWADVPETTDLVMYWWSQAAQLELAGKLSRFGFITTNSISQAFNRRVIETATQKKPGISLAFVIPDHPWVDSSDGADVRISMTVATTGEFANGLLMEVVSERPFDDGEIDVTLRGHSGIIHSDLSVGANIVGAHKLQANSNVCFQGMNLVGKGFRLEPAEVAALGFDARALPNVVQPHCNARDLMQGGEHCYVIDFFGYDAGQARELYPSLYQRLFDRVKPERDQNNRESRRRNWWLFGEPVGRLRKAWKGIRRMILTPETSKHRVFTFQEKPFCPDHTLYAICLDDAVALGVLSSSVHTLWALSAGSRLGVGNDPRWKNTTCFATFPFPTHNEQQQRIRQVSEQLDAHRKRQHAAHSELTLTGMYNVLEKLRSGESLNGREKTIHEQGLVSVLRELHDELDAAVLNAYGWPELLPILRIAHGNNPPSRVQSREDAARAFEEAVLERLVALNAERAAEEARGVVQWLRPEFQAAGTTLAPHQVEIETDPAAAEMLGDSVAAAKLKPKAWPKDPLDQVRAVADILSASPTSLSVEDITSRFASRGPWKKRVEPLLDMLVTLGRASEQGGRYRARS